MQKIHAAITAVGGYTPDYILTNAELETRVDTNPNRHQRKAHTER